MKFIFEGQVGIQVLGSGSAGNATVIHDHQYTLVVDAGLSGRELLRRLGEQGYSLGSLKAVLLTHEHQDHVRGLKGLSQKSNIPVWANPQTVDYLKSRGFDKINWQLFDTGKSFEVNPFSVNTFPVPHDAYDPCGFMIKIGRVNIGILTDLGYCTDIVREYAAQCEVLFLEANYDERLLAEDTKRPWATKQRIMARHGHLSNRQASELLQSFQGKKSPLKHVFLAHMSEDCNAGEVAIEEIRRGLMEAGLVGVEVHLTYQSQCSERVVL